jgi:hypothetical protein
MMFEDGNLVELRGRTNSGSFPPSLPIGVFLLKLVEINVINRGDVERYYLRKEQSAYHRQAEAEPSSAAGLKQDKLGRPRFRQYQMAFSICDYRL